MAGYSARQSSFTTGDTITAAHSNNEFNAILAAFHVSTGHTHDGSTAGDGGPLSTLYSNAISMGTGADTDIAVTFNANSNDGVITWMEDEDYFKFSDDILVDSTEKLQFRDTAIYLYSSADGQLDLVADTEIQIAATTVDINGNVDISGTLTIGSAGISEAELEILDGATVTTTELNIIDGDTSATSTTVADADRVVYNDAGTMKQVAVTDLDTYISATSKTLTNKTLTSPVLNTGVSGTAIKDEDNMASDSATHLATQQSIKAYVDTKVTAEDLDVSSDSGTIAIDLDSETLTIAGGTGLASSATSNTVTLAIDSTVTTLTGSQTLTNKTLTSPVIDTGVSGTAILDEDNMSSDSATKLATQQSIKAYVDSSVSGVGTTWTLEDDDGTEVGVAAGKEVKFIGSGLTTNWTDTDNGTDGDPFDMTFTIDAAQTGITSILATDLKIGEDDETKIDFETANEIHFYANNTEQVYLADNIFGPQSDSDVDLGTTGVRWKDAYVDSITVTDDVTIGGDLTVNGTTTTVNSTTVTIDDPIFTLGGDSAPGSDDNKDRGIEFRWHNGSAAKIGFFGYDDSESAFTFIPDASNSSEVFSGTVGNVIFGNITGTLQTAAQTNITSVGALDGGSITSGFGAIDNGTSGIRTNTFTAETSIVPDASGGADLGTSSLEWGDLYIADDKKIYLGSDQNFSIEYDEDGNDTTAVVAANGISMAPHGSSAGNGTELRFQELAANGANYVGFKAPDSIAANKVFVLPNADGNSGQFLTTNGSLALSWADAGGGGTVDLVADGAITAGRPVMLTAAGKAQMIKETTTNYDPLDLTAETTATASSSDDWYSGHTVYNSASDTIIFSHSAQANGYPYITPATPNGDGSFTKGITTVLQSVATYGAEVATNTSTNEFVAAWTYATNTTGSRAVAGSITGSGASKTISVGSITQLDTKVAYHHNVVYDSTVDRYVLAAWLSSHSSQTKGQIYAYNLTVSGTSITVNNSGGTQIMNSLNSGTGADSGTLGLVHDPNAERILVMAYGLYHGGSAWKGWTLQTIQATTTAINGASNTPVVLDSELTSGTNSHGLSETCIGATYSPDDQKIMIAYVKRGASDDDNRGYAVMATLSSTSVSLGTRVAIDSDPAMKLATGYDEQVDKFIIYRSSGTGTSTKNADFYTPTVSGTSITIGSAIVVSGTTGPSINNHYFQNLPYVSTNYASYLQAKGPDYYVYSLQNRSVVNNFDASKYLGVAAASISDTATGTITLNGGINEAVSGLTVDKDYFCGVDGIIKEFMTSSTSTSDTQTGAHAQVVTNTTGDLVSSVYESNSGTFTIAFKDTSNSSYGTVVCGTESNGTFTWGTPVVFESSAIDSQPTLAAGGNRIHVAYRASDDNGGIRSASISGTTPTFAAETIFAPTGGEYAVSTCHHLAYDTSTNYVIILYKSYNGSAHKAWVQPVYHDTSDGTYTLGTASALFTGQLVQTRSCAVFDPDTNRTVIAYTDGSNSNYPTANVVQSSGTAGSPTVTIGADTLLNSTSESDDFDIVYDTTNNKAVIFFDDQGGGNIVKAVIGTVTGGTTNTIAVTSPSTIWDPSGNPNYWAAGYDEDKNRIQFFYHDEDSGDDFTYKVITPGASSLSVATGGVLSANQNKMGPGSTSFGTGKGVLCATEDSNNSARISYGFIYYADVVTYTQTDRQFLGRAIAADKLLLQEQDPDILYARANTAITKGKPVVALDDGELEQVSESGTLKRTGSESIGTWTKALDKETNTAGTMAVNKDGTQFLVSHVNSSYYPVVIAGTVDASGTISLGSSTVVKSASSNMGKNPVRYHKQHDKYWITYMDGTSGVEIAPLSVSGTSVTVGSVENVHGSDSANDEFYDSVYDPYDNKVWVVWYDQSAGMAKAMSTVMASNAGSFSSTSASSGISGGVAVNYLSASYVGNAGGSSKMACYFTDQSDDSHVVVFAVNGSYSTSNVVEISTNSSSTASIVYNPDKNTNIIAGMIDSQNDINYCTVDFSGSDPSLGTITEITGTSMYKNKPYDDHTCVYNSYTQQYVINYTEASNYYSEYKIGTSTDGLTITWGSAVTGTDAYSNVTCAYAANHDAKPSSDYAGSEQFFLLRRVDGSTNEVQMLLHTPTYDVTTTGNNLTTENYVGIAQNTASANEEVRTKYTNIDDQQEGLTSGQMYYVQNDGSLSTTPATPSVEAGKALSASKLLVKT